MNETELRDLLHRVVPEPPSSATDPGPAARAGRRGRSRRRVAVTGAAVGVAATVAAAGVAWWPSEDRIQEAMDAWNERPAVDTTTYDVAPCPDELPALSAANRTLPDLDRVVSVRLCGDSDTFQYLREPPTAAETRWLTPADALVWSDHREAFGNAVRGLPITDRGRCATIDTIGSGTSLAIELTGAETVLVPTDYCTDLTLDGRRISAGEVAQAFLAGLDAQRDTVRYETDATGPLTCRTRPTTAPVRPGRDPLVDAIWCPPYDSGSEATELDEESMDRLTDAWARTPDSVPDDDDGDTRCSGTDDDQPFVVLRTALDDVAWLSASPCGFSVMSDWRPGHHFEVPVDVAELK